MGKFSKKTSTRARSNQPNTVNRAGGLAFKESPQLEFISLLFTSFLKDKFYESGDEQLQRLQALVDLIPDKVWLAKAAIYTRNTMGMRSITHALIGELLQVVKGKSSNSKLSPIGMENDIWKVNGTWTRAGVDGTGWLVDAIVETIRRPDDMYEILAYQLQRAGKPVPNPLKRALALALNKFTPYSLAKYRGEGGAVKLVDILNLAHPAPDKEQKALFESIVEGKLKSTDTWEAKLTKAGQEGEDESEVEELKEKAWTELLKENKLGYFALLRNLRNIAKQAPDAIPLALQQLVNPDAIHKSLVLPFRFLTAMEAVQGEYSDSNGKIIEALSQAIDIAFDNVPKFDGKTLVVLDESGSMGGRPWNIGSMFAVALYKANQNCDLMTFAGDARYHTYNKKDSLMGIIRSLDYNGGSTNFQNIFRKAKSAYDRIVILSDMQGWDEYNTPTKEFADYKRKFQCDPYVFSFDLNGYGDLQLPENKVFALAGWSEKVFNLMKLIEQDKQIMVDAIGKVEL